MSKQHRTPQRTAEQVAAEASGIGSSSNSASMEAMNMSQGSVFGSWFSKEEPKVLENTIGPALEEMDHAFSKLEMAGNYQIVDDASQKQNPNDITAEEFEAITKRVSDIRMGKAALRIDGSNAADPEAFEQQQMQDLQEMMKTESGRKLVMDLSDLEKSKGHTTTLTYEYDASSSGPVDASKKGDSFDGTGTDARIKLSRTGDQRQENFDEKGGDLVQTTDTVLFHEMVHAWHTTQGTEARYETGHHHEGGSAHPNDEHLCRAENQATGLVDFAEGDRNENAYRAEQRKLGELRGDASAADRYGHRPHYSDLPGSPGGSATSRPNRSNYDCSEAW